MTTHVDGKEYDVIFAGGKKCNFPLDLLYSSFTKEGPPLALLLAVSPSPTLHSPFSSWKAARITSMTPP